MVRALLTLGAKDVANKQGITPSSLGTEAGHTECAAVITRSSRGEPYVAGSERRGMLQHHLLRPVVLQVKRNTRVPKNAAMRLQE